MDLLSRLERVLEDMVEGVFSRAFRTEVQPIEVFKRLTREMEAHRRVSIHTTYVPNVYIVRLAPETHAGLEAISGRLLAELEQYLREFAAEHEYQMVGPLAVRLQPDDGVKAKEIHIEVADEPGASPSTALPPNVLRSYPTGGTRTAPSAPSDADSTILISAAPATALEIIAGDGAGRQLPLTDELTIGRGPTNTLALADPGVSRQHAQISWQDEAWVLRDLGSTNGTLVNGRKITTHVLRVGDVIKIGPVTLRAK